MDEPKLNLIRQLVFLLSSVDQLENDLFSLTRSDAPSIRALTFSPIPPGFWYELTFLEHVNVYSAVAGLTDHLNKQVKTGLLFTGKEELLDVDTPTWIDEDSDELRRSVFFSALYALIKSMQAIKRVSQPLNELIAEGANGNRDSLKLAIKLDPAAVGSPSVSSMIVYHELKGKNDFRKDLYNALKNPRKYTQQNHPFLRFVLRMMYEDGLLQTLSEEDRYDFFCVELNLYPIEGKDPAGGLNRWIRRWQEAYVRTRHDQVVSSPFRDYVINFLDLVQNQEVENETTEEQTGKEGSE